MNDATYRRHSESVLFIHHQNSTQDWPFMMDIRMKSMSNLAIFIENWPFITVITNETFNIPDPTLEREVFDKTIITCPA